MKDKGEGERMNPRRTWRVLSLILLMTLQSCGSNDGEGLSKIPRCLTKEEALTRCLAIEIGSGLNMEQARLRCEPFFRVDSCY